MLFSLPKEIATVGAQVFLKLGLLHLSYLQFLINNLPFFLRRLFFT